MRFTVSHSPIYAVLKERTRNGTKQASQVFSSIFRLPAIHPRPLFVVSVDQLMSAVLMFIRHHMGTMATFLIPGYSIRLEYCKGLHDSAECPSVLGRTRGFTAAWNSANAHFTHDTVYISRDRRFPICLGSRLRLLSRAKRGMCVP